MADAAVRDGGCARVSDADARWGASSGWDVGVFAYGGEDHSCGVVDTDCVFWVFHCNVDGVSSEVQEKRYSGVGE